MSEIMLVQPVTAARCSMNVRSATTADLPFIDGLQKMHTHMVGWMPFKSLEGHLAKGRILIAEGTAPLGYVLSADQYMKRDDVGIIYQLNVAPHTQRGLVGANLIKAVFDRAAYGCRLFCCWCAQDIQANYFWESIGFVPLAFRTGSRSKQRIHIFWQRRIREGDDGPPTGTPYWFPSQTSGGAVGEDRIVLPIPAGAHWRDAKPLVLPNAPQESLQDGVRALPAQLPGGALVKPRPVSDERPKLSQAQKAAIHRMQSKHLGGVPLGKKAVLTGNGVKYVDRTDFVPETDTPEELIEAAKPKRARRAAGAAQRAKHDPKYTAAARELRDRFLEQVNSGQILLESTNAKYEVSRALPPAEEPMSLQEPLRLTAEAA